MTSRAVELVRAACSENVRTAARMLAAEPALARADLYTACATGEADLVAELLERDRGSARHPGGPLGWEPILYACFSRFLLADPRRAHGIVALVRQLLGHGANPNAHYIGEWANEPIVQTALYGAAGIANEPTITALLLDAGADVDELAGAPRGGPGGLGPMEALYHASESPDTTCLRLLLEARPHPARVTYCFARMLDFDNPPGALLYLDHGADPNYRGGRARQETHMHKALAGGRAVRVIERMIEVGGDVDSLDGRGVSLYRYAVRSGRRDVAELLAGHGARTDGVTDEDRSLGAIVRGDARDVSGPISADAAANVLFPAAARNEVDVVRRLLDAGVDPNAADGGEGFPLLHSACWRGRLEMSALLLERGASLTQRNQYGGDALDAVIHGSLYCHDPEGGMTMRLPGDVRHGDYAGVAEFLLSAGAALPSQLYGSEAVRAVLERHGVADREDVRRPGVEGERGQE